LKWERKYLQFREWIFETTLFSAVALINFAMYVIFTTVPLIFPFVRNFCEPN